MKKLYEEIILESDLDILNKECKKSVEELKKLFKIYFNSFDPVNMLDYKISRILLMMKETIDENNGSYIKPYKVRYKSQEKRYKIYKENKKEYDIFFNELRNDMKQDLITMKRASKDIINEIDILSKLFRDNNDINEMYFKQFFKVINEKQLKEYIKISNSLQKGFKLSDQEIIKIIIQEDFYKGRSQNIDDKIFLFIDPKSYLGLTLIEG